MTEKLIKENENAFYVFDTKTLRNRVAHIRNSLPGDRKSVV